MSFAKCVSAATHGQFVDIDQHIGYNFFALSIRSIRHQALFTAIIQQFTYNRGNHSMKKIFTPIDDQTIIDLNTGDMVLLSGDIYTARDAAHKRMFSCLSTNESPPFKYECQAVFYAGPCPTPPGKIIGSVGPTTSGRMDAYAPALIRAGLKVMIGKGERSPAVKEAIRAHGGLYLTAVGGVAALMSLCVTRVELIAYDDLGTEAIRRLTVKDLPLIVAYK
jgi:fumarate hydratase subunit beta